MRHEVPLAIPDPFLYAEGGGERRRGRELVRARPDRAGRDRSSRSRRSRSSGSTSSTRRASPVTRSSSRSSLRALHGASGSSRRAVPPTFPLELADHLRADGIELSSTASSSTGDAGSRTTPSSPGSAARSAPPRPRWPPRATFCGAASRTATALVLDGEPLTCERIKAAIEQASSPPTASWPTSSSSRTARRPPSATTWARGRSRRRADRARPLPARPRVRLLRRHDAHVRGRRAARGARRVPPALQRGARRVGRRREAGRHRKRPPPDLLRALRGARLPDAALEAAGRGRSRTASSTRSGTASGSRCTSSRRSAGGAGRARRRRRGRRRARPVPPGFGGCRLEDLVLVTENGAEVLTEYPYDLQP